MVDALCYTQFPKSWDGLRKGILTVWCLISKCPWASLYKNIFKLGTCDTLCPLMPKIYFATQNKQAPPHRPKIPAFYAPDPAPPLQPPSLLLQSFAVCLTLVFLLQGSVSRLLPLWNINRDPSYSRTTDPDMTPVTVPIFTLLWPWFQPRPSTSMWPLATA